MKEHSLFLKAGFTPANPDMLRKAEYYKTSFENVLSKAILFSDNTLGKDVLTSGEIVTGFTAKAEIQTEKYTGIRIDKSLTSREKKLSPRMDDLWISENAKREIKRLNRRSIVLLDGLIDFKEHVLSEMLSCRIFTVNYPLLIEHMIREAKLYRRFVHLLEENGELDRSDMKDTECFWNRIMMEHAMFIRGSLDPSEESLFDTADEFADDYTELLKQCKSTQDKMLTEASLGETKKFRDFKTAGVEGIEECKIRSIILPLLADHMLREANHYIRLLEQK